MKTAAFLVLLVIGSQVVVGQSNESPKAAVQASPDLVPLLHRPMDGLLRVKNIGTGPASPSKLTLDCVRVESHQKMYSCPNLPITKMQEYFDPAFPNNATIQVPALAPGATFTHMLSFWGEMKWPSGTYKFTAVADAAGAVSESNRKNNIAISIFTAR